LRWPPLTRKKTQQFTARLNPNANEMNSKFGILGPVESAVSEEGVLAVCVAVKAISRNIKVPKNSPRQ
jgi:hypothetical protein